MYIREPAEIRKRYRLTCVHVSALAVIWTYVYASLNAGGDEDLRFCISQRRRSYGLTFMHMRASRGSWGLQMLLWLRFRMHFQDAASESIPKHCFCSARALASAECIIIIKRHAHDRPNQYVRNARESVQLRLLFLSSEHSQTCVSPKPLHS